MILPTRTYAEGEIGDALANSGAEALIYVKLVDAYSTSSYVPPTYSTSGSATTYGNTTSLNTTTYQYGGYNINKPVEKYEISVTDLNNWQTVMVSSGTTKGNAFANSEDLSDSLASEIVDELIANGLIAPNR